MSCRISEIDQWEAIAYLTEYTLDEGTLKALVTKPLALLAIGVFSSYLYAQYQWDGSSGSRCPSTLGKVAMVPSLSFLFLV
ncbi:hypothetical protein NIES4073_03690 (plasmid) [Kalymmatonema gypsitolerans NIES-4073]|nr:hypothetical protein NIES4073_03690 [Scytonema sp. NIES-4073]